MMHEMLDDLVLVKIYRNLTLKEQIRMEIVSKKSRKISLATYATCQKLNFSINFNGPIDPDRTFSIRLTTSKAEDLMGDVRRGKAIHLNTKCFEKNLDGFLERFKKFNELAVCLSNHLSETSSYASSLLEKMNQIVFHVSKFSLQITNNGEKVDSEYLTPVIKQMLKVKNSVKSLHFKSGYGIENDQSVWDLLAEFKKVRRISLNLNQNIVNSKSLRNWLKSQRIRQLTMENTGKVLNDNEAPFWLSETFGDGNSKLKCLKLFGDINKIYADPIVDDILQNLRKVCINFDFANWTNESVLRRIFDQISTKNRQSEIEILSQPSTDGHSFVIAQAVQRFLETLFGISDDQLKRRASSENLVKITLGIKSQVYYGFLYVIREIQNSGQFGAIEVCTEEVPAMKSHFHNQIHISYNNGNLQIGLNVTRYGPSILHFAMNPFPRIGPWYDDNCLGEALGLLSD